MRGLTYGGWGHGLALGRQRCKTLRQVRLLSREQMRQPFGCICDDKACNVCTPEPEPDEKETEHGPDDTGRG